MLATNTIIPWLQQAGESTAFSLWLWFIILDIPKAKPNKNLPHQDHHHPIKRIGTFCLTDLIQGLEWQGGRGLSLGRQSFRRYNTIRYYIYDTIRYKSIRHTPVDTTRPAPFSIQPPPIRQPNIRIRYGSSHQHQHQRLHQHQYQHQQLDWQFICHTRVATTWLTLFSVHPPQIWQPNLRYL